MGSAADAEKAILEGNGYDIDGRQLRVAAAKPRESGSRSNALRIPEGRVHTRGQLQVRA